MTAQLAYTIAIPVGVASICFLSERAWPLRTNKIPLVRRLLTNGFLSILSYATAGFFVHPIATHVLSWNYRHDWGLLRLFKVPSMLELLLGLLLLDLTFYYWHRLNHQSSFFWRFHQVHHCDEDLDFSTGLRFHFGEVTMSALFRVAQVLLTGVTVKIFAIYVILFQISTFFHHSNIRLPWRLEKILQRGFVTPRMHEFHHSINLKETHSNYSVVFSLWDRIHNTETKIHKEQKTAIGLVEFEDQSSTNFRSLLLLPFRRKSRG